MRYPLDGEVWIDKAGLRHRIVERTKDGEQAGADEYLVKTFDHQWVVTWAAILAAGWAPDLSRET